jgi:hypothetical protein
MHGISEPDRICSAWLSQILNLLLLSPQIQEAVFILQRNDLDRKCYPRNNPPFGLGRPSQDVGK